MPYYCGPRLQATPAIIDASDELHIQTLLTNIVMHRNFGATHLSCMPVKFGHLSNNVSVLKSGAGALLNWGFAQCAQHAMGFIWVVHYFSNGHFS